MRYDCWDSCSILGWLKEEPDKVDLCRAGIEAARRGDFKLAVSTLAVAEVLRLNKKEPIEADEADKVRSFFESELVVMVELSPDIAFSAQRVVWNEGIKPKDAVHVATALHLQGLGVATRLITFDDALVKRNDMLRAPGATVPLVITKPDYQLLLPGA